MKKLYILIIIVFFLSFKNVISAVDLTDGLIDYFPFDDGGGDVIGTNNSFNNLGGASINSSAKLGNALWCDGDDMPVKDGTDNNFMDTEWSICAWIYKTGSWGAAGLSTIYGHTAGDGTGTTGVIMGYGNPDNEPNTWVHSGSWDNNDLDAGESPKTNEWDVLCIVYNGGTLTQYTNKTQVDSGSHSAGAGANEYLCKYDQYYSGGIDMLAVWDKALNISEIDMYYFNGTGCPPVNGSCQEEAAAASPTLTLNWNLINETQNFNDPSLFVTYNGTFTDQTTTTVNCSFYVNNVLNMSDTDVDISGLQDFNLSIGQIDDRLNFSLNCSNFENDDSIGDVWYDVDTINPILLSDFVNHTVYNTSDDITIRYNCSDNNLFASNMTIYSINGSIWGGHNYFAQNLSNPYTNITTITIAEQDSDNYTIRMDCWDSHTTIEISQLDYKFKQFPNGLEVNDLLIYGDNIEEIKYYYKRDRFEFEFKMINKSDFLEIFISGDDLYYISDSSYAAHFVYLYQYWVDFVSVEAYSHDIEQISSSTYKITLYFSDEINKFKTKSIGDLNHVSRVYSFSIQEAESLTEIRLGRILDEAEEINASVGNIEEAIIMIPFVMLYVAFMFLGYHLIFNGSVLSGYLLYLLTIYMDFGLTAWMYTTYSVYIVGGIASNLYTYFMYGVFFWVMFKVIMVASLRRKRSYV